MKYIKFIDKFPSLEGKLYIVTGANSGLGFDTSLYLAYKGASVILACRNLERAEKAKNRILNEVPNAKLFIEQYDQADFNSIEKFSNNIKDNYSHIDGIICNAGVYFPKQDYKTKDGYELTFGTNYLGTFKLLYELKYKLNDDHSRVVIVTSLTATLSNKSKDINNFSSLNSNQVYGYSKYCLSRLFSELKNENNNINYYLVHPGIASTNIISSLTSSITLTLPFTSSYFPPSFNLSLTKITKFISGCSFICSFIICNFVFIMLYSSSLNSILLSVRLAVSLTLSSYPVNAANGANCAERASNDILFLVFDS